MDGLDESDVPAKEEEASGRKAGKVMAVVLLCLRRRRCAEGGEDGTEALVKSPVVGMQRSSWDESVILDNFSVLYQPRVVERCCAVPVAQVAGHCARRLC